MEEQKEQIEQAKAELDLLRALNLNEGFQLWRDQYVKPTLDQLERDLAKADDLPEVTLRANLKTSLWLNEFFYGMFEKAEVQREQLK